MSEHDAFGHPRERVTTVGAAERIYEDTGTIERAFIFETPAGRFVRRETTASDAMGVELFRLLEDGTEVYLDGYVFELSVDSEAVRVDDEYDGELAEVIPFPTRPAAAPIERVPFPASDDPVVMTATHCRVPCLPPEPEAA